MTSFTNILSQFQTVSLAEMDSVKLMDRVEMKYAFSSTRLEGILQQLTGFYRVLSIGGKTMSSYETTYFDTPRLGMYLLHHNKKLNRHKVRFRKYADTDELFFEVKFKSNKNRTIKKRLAINGGETTISETTSAFLAKHSPYQKDELQPSVNDFYKRITLVSLHTAERVTIDTQLTFSHNSDSISFPGLVIAEVKQPASSQSLFVKLMHNSGIHPVSISKYCLGIASLYPGIKKNSIKPKLLYVNKICDHPVL